MSYMPKDLSTEEKYGRISFLDDLKTGALFLGRRADMLEIIHIVNEVRSRSSSESTAIEIFGCTFSQDTVVSLISDLYLLLEYCDEN
jgi:hypothetical protein